MLTEQSTLKQLRETPVGHDIIATLKAEATEQTEQMELADLLG